MVKIYYIDDNSNDSFIEIEGTVLTNISFKEMSLHRAMLFEKDLSKSDFSRANLRGAYLEWANLMQAVFEDANLISAYLRNAHLRESVLVRTRLSGALLDGANLICADLTGADIWGASFKGANFVGAICNFVRYDDAEFEGAIYDDSTVWPKGFDAKARGLIKVSNRDGKKEVVQDKAKPESGPRSG